MRGLVLGALLLAGCLQLQPIPPLGQDLGIAPFAPDPGGPAAPSDWFVLPLDDAAHGFTLDVPAWAVVEHESGWRYISLEYKILTARDIEPVEEFMLLLFVETPDGLELREGDIKDHIHFNWTRHADGETFGDADTMKPSSADAHWVRMGVPPGQGAPERVVAVVSGDTAYATGVVFAWSPRILSGYELLWGDGWHTDEPSVVRDAVRAETSTVGRLIGPSGSSGPWRHENIDWLQTDPTVIVALSRQWTDGFSGSRSLAHTDIHGAYAQHGVAASLAPGGFAFMQAAMGVTGSGDWSVAAAAGARHWEHEASFRHPPKQTPDELAPLGLDRVYVDSLPQMRLQGDGLGAGSLRVSWMLEAAPPGARVIAQAIQAPVPLEDVAGMPAAELTCTVQGAAEDVLDPLRAGQPPNVDPGLWRYSSWCYRHLPQPL